MKKSFRKDYFFGGFFMVVILVMGVTGFCLVDQSTETYGKNLMTPMMGVDKNSPLSYTVSFMGYQLELDLTEVNQGMGTLQKYATAIVPAKYLLLFQGRELVKMAMDFAEEQYREWEFQQNIQE